MFGSVISIANRGEIACRIIRAARRLGMRDDRGPFCVSIAGLCTRAWRMRRSASVRRRRATAISMARVSSRRRKRWARIASIRATAFFVRRTRLSPRFAWRLVIVFIGPPPAAIRAMGLRAMGQGVGCKRPACRWFPDIWATDQDPAFLAERAAETGYPVLIKAVAGGGGKGMRRADRAADFAAALDEAPNARPLFAFGDDRVLIEKFIDDPRHIEMRRFSPMGSATSCICSNATAQQRRRQKVIEEAPAPGAPPAMRAAMAAAAIEAARAVGYVGAGTVEFIAEGGATPSGRFWFMEMNTRLQVEHPVTEAITGVDLVEWQFRIAAGERLPLRQPDIVARGHAVEARLYAEDPTNGFLPSTGKLWALRLPEGEGVRVDSGVEEGDEITPFYDPMIAKIIAWGPTRGAALDRLARALDDTIVLGPRCNLALLGAIVGDRSFRVGDFDTGFIERHHVDLGVAPREVDPGAAAFGAAIRIESRDKIVRSRIASQRFAVGRRGRVPAWRRPPNGNTRNSSSMARSSSRRSRMAWITNWLAGVSRKAAASLLLLGTSVLANE